MAAVLASEAAELAAHDFGGIADREDSCVLEGYCAGVLVEEVREQVYRL